MKTENWINEVLNSTNGMIKVIPDDSLFSNIQNRMQLKNSVSSKTLWLVAASIAILLTVNISAIIKNKSKTESKLEAFLPSTLDKSNQLY